MSEKEGHHRADHNGREVGEEQQKRPARKPGQVPRQKDAAGR